MVCLRTVVLLGVLAGTLSTCFAQSGRPACYAIRVRTLITHLGYSASFRLLGGCAAGTVNVTRLYEQGACAKTRDNNFQSLPDCATNNGSVTSSDEETCRRVFAAGPASAFVGSSLSLNNSFDAGTVCNSISDYGYFFVRTTCATFPAVTNQPLDSFFTYSNYRAPGCDGVFGWGNGNSGSHVSRVVTAIIVVVVCVLVGLCVFGTFAALRRKRAMQMQQVQMQQFPPQGPYQQPYGGAQGPYYGAQAPGGQPYNQPYANRPQPGAQPYGAPYNQPYNQYGGNGAANGKPVQGIPVGGQPGGSGWHTDTSPGTYPPRPGAPAV